MSGHSKWASIKHKKGALDAKRGRIFTRIIKEITVAARMGGGSIDGNPRLRTAVDDAKAENMPKDNIERAIKKGTGELPGVIYEEATYEGYGPGGVAIIIDIMSDNKTRTVAEIRNLLTKNGGHLADSGSVAWMFHRKGVILVEKKNIDEDKLMAIALDAGAEDFKSDQEEVFEIITLPENFETIKNVLITNKINPSFAETTRVPQSTVELKGKEAQQCLRLMEQLDDNDDIQKTYANFDISEEEMAN